MTEENNGIEAKRREALETIQSLLDAIKVVVKRYSRYEISEPELKKIVPVLTREVNKVHTFINQHCLEPSKTP